MLRSSISFLAAELYFLRDQEYLHEVGDVLSLWFMLQEMECVVPDFLL